MNAIFGCNTLQHCNVSPPKCLWAGNLAKTRQRTGIPKIPSLRPPNAGGHEQKLKWRPGGLRNLGQANMVFSVDDSNRSHHVWHLVALQSCAGLNTPLFFFMQPVDFGKFAHRGVIISHWILSSKYKIEVSDGLDRNNTIILTLECWVKRQPGFNFQISRVK